MYLDARTGLIIMADKRADLAGPGISTYSEVDKVLPNDYNSLLSKKDTQKALYLVKRYIEENLEKELNSYVWDDKKAGIPIDANNHLIDAMRYVFMDNFSGVQPYIFWY